MFKFEANEAVIMKQQEIIEAALSTDPKMEKRLRRLISDAVVAARQELMQNINLPNDPRGAKHSIRRAVYKKVLGANLNILNRRKAAAEKANYEPPRTLKPWKPGGNRVKRGARTQQVMSYGPADRGFILRFLNSGTETRTAGTRGGKISGNRGSIAARNFFANAGDQALTNMADRLSAVIEDELTSVFGEG